MNTKIEFKGCKHLDFDPNYAAKRQLTEHGLFWLREQQPSMVQFCKKRGRLNGCKSCLSERYRSCSEYEEITHIIDLPIAELES